MQLANTNFLESIQVYRVQLGGDKRLLIAEDLTRGTPPQFKPTTGRGQSR